MRSASITGSAVVVQSSRSPHRKCCPQRPSPTCVVTSSLKASPRRPPELRQITLSSLNSKVYRSPTYSLHEACREQTERFRNISSQCKLSVVPQLLSYCRLLCPAPLHTAASACDCRERCFYLFSAHKMLLQNGAENKSSSQH